MFKILYELNGEQKIVLVTKTGSVCAEAQVLWDERIDGPAPEGLMDSLGGYVKGGQGLVVDQEKLAVAVSAIAEVELEKATQASALKQSQDLIESIDVSKGINAGEVSDVLSALVHVVRQR